MSAEKRLYMLLRELGIPFNGRTEGDGSTTIQIRNTNIVFDKYGRYIETKDVA